MLQSVGASWESPCDGVSSEESGLLAFLKRRPQSAALETSCLPDSCHSSSLVSCRSHLHPHTTRIPIGQSSVKSRSSCLAVVTCWKTRERTCWRSSCSSESLGRQYLQARCFLLAEGQVRALQHWFDPSCHSRWSLTGTGSAQREKKESQKPCNVRRIRLVSLTIAFFRPFMVSCQCCGQGGQTAKRGNQACCESLCTSQPLD